MLYPASVPSQRAGIRPARRSRRSGDEYSALSMEMTTQLAGLPSRLTDLAGQVSVSAHCLGSRGTSSVRSQPWCDQSDHDLQS